MARSKVLFLCTHNSARSLMAEALLMYYQGEVYEAYSAGTHPSGVDPMTIEVLREIGVPVEGLRSKHLEEFLEMGFEAVITVCDNAREACPFFPGAKRYVHVGFKDPRELVERGMGPLEAFRETRDEIGSWIRERFVS